MDATVFLAGNSAWRYKMESKHSLGHTITFSNGIHATQKEPAKVGGTVLFCKPCHIDHHFNYLAYLTPPTISYNSTTNYPDLAPGDLIKYSC